jgi:dihydroorotase-like cyclic amidohydrolase
VPAWASARGRGRWRGCWSQQRYVCSPPPRDTASQEACWDGLERGVFDLFSSDHCPFRYDDPAGKLNPKGSRSFRHIPNGIPGVELRLPILFSEEVMKGRIDLPRFVALTAANQARTYGLYPQKGTITVGQTPISPSGIPASPAPSAMPRCTTAPTTRRMKGVN